MKVNDLQASYGIHNSAILNYLKNIPNTDHDLNNPAEYKHRVEVLHQMSNGDIMEFNRSKRFLNYLKNNGDTK